MVRNDVNENAPLWKHVVAGACSGWMTSIITCPLDVIKVRLQTSKSALLSSPSQRTQLSTQLLAIWRSEGLGGLYRGLGLTMVGYLPTFSIYFPTYHHFKLTISHFRKKPSESDSVTHILSAVIAGAVTNLTTNPLWIIRTRLMTQDILADKPYANTFDAFRSVWKNEGLRGFYKGASVSVIGVIHVAVQFPFYERLKQFQSKYGEIGPLNIFIASTLSKVVASTTTYPHEIVRTRLQIQRSGTPKYKGVLDCCTKIIKEEGFLGFYKGLRVNILRIIPASGVTFLTYESIVKYL